MSAEGSPNDQKATLGCGSLILIALIVLIFSNSGNSDLENQLNEVSKKLTELEKTIGEQSVEIEKLRDSLKE